MQDSEATLLTSLISLNVKVTGHFCNDILFHVLVQVGVGAVMRGPSV